MKRKGNTLVSMAIAIVIMNCNAFGQIKEPKRVKLDTMDTVSLRSLPHNAFRAGEFLRYRLHYGFVDAGEATIEVEKSKKIKGREVLHVIGKGRTLGAFNWFFKVNDRYETYLDEQGVFPWKFVRRVHEGNYKKSQDYFFHQDRSTVDNGAGKNFEIPMGVQDMISSFYYARTLNFEDLEIDDVMAIETFVDDELFTLNVQYKGKENIKLRAGEFRCMKFVPVVQEGRIFEKADDMQVWITDDENRIPILAKAKILVGSIKMEVVEYSGLSNEIAKID
ncbi:MAG: DUF3108 domain-containing protein [Bacteroidota bacterium]